MATANVLTYAQIFSQVLDEQMTEILTSAWMEANASQVQYSGGNTVNVPKMSLEGMGNYDQVNGFPSGAATLTWEPRVLTQDRGKEFNIDSRQVDETNFVLQASPLVASFQKDYVAPEVDAYRYSKIFNLSMQQLKIGAYTPVVATVFTQLETDLNAIQDVIGEAEPLVIVINHLAASILGRSTEFDKDVSIDDFMVGGISTKVQTFNGVPLIRVPSARMKTEYVFSATNGFSAGAGANQINWIICPRSAVLAVVKTDKVRIFSPDVNQDLDAWKMQFRKFHDVWIMDNKFAGIYVSYTSAAAVAPTVTIAAGSASGTTKATVTKVTSTNTLAYKVSASATTGILTNQIVPAGTTAYTSGANITILATEWLDLYELDATNHVVRFVSHDMTSGEIST